MAEVTGRVTRGVVAPTSKSERETLLVEAEDGGVHILRRRGAPAWGEEDPELAALVGRRVSLRGTLLPGTLLVDAWRELAEP